MTSIKKSRTEISFSEMYDSIDESDKLLIETRILMYRFLSEIEKISAERGLNHKKLAKLIGTSPSYITQLFRGKKIINLNTLVKFQKALGFKFRIEAELPGRKVGKEENEKMAYALADLPVFRRNAAAGVVVKEESPGRHMKIAGVRLQKSKRL